MAKQSFKEKAKNSYDKAKSKVKDTYNKAKNKAMNYANDLSIYYDEGYKKGWNDCKSANSPFGASLVGGVGYGIGYRNKKRMYKNQAKARQLARK